MASNKPTRLLWVHRPWVQALIMDAKSLNWLAAAFRSSSRHTSQRPGISVANYDVCPKQLPRSKLLLILCSFYLAYLCGEFPSNFLLQRWALGRTLSIYMLCWGKIHISSYLTIADKQHRSLCHHCLCCSKLGSAYGYPRPARFLRMHHLTRIHSHNRNMVSERGTLFPCSLLAICQCWFRYHRWSGQLWYWRPCWEAWWIGSLARNIPISRCNDFACKHGMFLAARESKRSQMDEQGREEDGVSVSVKPWSLVY